MPTDTELLDWMDKQTTGYGAGIIFRQSTTGRGWRLHETSDVWEGRAPKKTVREAIADAMSRCPTSGTKS